MAHDPDEYFSKYSINLSDIEFSEILRCEYNTDYNYGNFRISINKFLDQMRSLKIPYELNYIQEDSSSSHEDDKLFINPLCMFLSVSDAVSVYMSVYVSGSVFAC